MASRRRRRDPGEAERRTLRVQLKVRVPAVVRQEIRSYIRAHKEYRLTQDQLVLNALHSYMDMTKESPDAILYRRLDRLQRDQERISTRVDMIGQMFTEFLFYWFRLWPELSQEVSKKRRRKAVELLSRYLSSLNGSLTRGTDEAIDILDLESIEQYLTRSSSTTHRS